MKKNLANIITATRIIGTLCLIPLKALSVPFFVFYVWCGLSDVLDGFVARKLNTVSNFGSKLDSVSDLLFYTTMMLKVWPYLKAYLPLYVWVLIYLVLAIRFLCYVYVGIKYNTFASRHTIFNKITGVLMFLLPFVVNTKYLVYYSLVVLAVGYTSVIDEIIYIINKK